MRGTRGSLETDVEDAAEREEAGERSVSGGWGSLFVGV